MSGSIRARINGYLVAGSVGLSIGLVIDAIDMEVLLAKKDKTLKVLTAIALVIGAVSVAYHEPSIGNSEVRQAGSPPDPHDQPPRN